jgi:zinc transport system substrate-binding protein
MKSKYTVFIIGLLLIAVVGFAYRNSVKSNVSVSRNKLQVFASFYPMYFLAMQIGGDKADVRNITPAGVEPHDYEPSTRDIAQIESGNMLILNGGVEAWGDKMKYNLKGTKVKVITAGAGLLTKDPHIWLDPILVKQEVVNIEKGFEEIDPKNAAYFQKNAKELNIKLDQLNTDFKQGLSSCQQKDFITSHAAFAYLAGAYGLRQISISGLSPDQEPSARQLADIAKFAKENNVKYIFFESLVSPKLSETIASEIGAKTLVLDPIEGISDDNIKKGKNYFTVMKDNLKNLQTALQCSK